MKSWHILHVITGIERGGAENHLFDLVKHQLALGMRVTVAYLRGRGYWAPALRKLGARVDDLKLRFYGDPRPLNLLRAILAETRFDLIHAHLPPAELYTRVALALRGDDTTPFIITKHNDCPFHRLPGERALGRWVARRAKMVIAISEAVHRYMTGPALGLPASQVRTIRYGIESSPYENVPREKVTALRREWGVKDDTFVIGFAGRFVEQKAIPKLLEAYALFYKTAPCDTRLVLAGRGALDAELRLYAARAGIVDHVVWAGFREDVPVMMRAFDAFALTSVHEGFGLVLVEAMAAERPVIATRSGAIPEVVIEGETGFLAITPEDFAEALTKLCDRNLRARFGAAGRRRVKECFDLDRMCAETDAAYLDLLPQANPAHAIP